MTRYDSFDPPEANPAIRRDTPTPPDGQGPWDFVAQSLLMGWRWLSRMRTALYLLAALAALTLLATAVPQQPNVASTVARWRAGTAGPGVIVSKIIDVFGGYDVFGSPLFMALLMLLFISLTACLIPRYRAWWRILRHTRPPRSRHVSRQPEIGHLATDLSPGEALERTRAHLAKKRWRLRDPALDEGAEPQVAAEKGHLLREGGSLVFHTAFYVLLVSVILGQLLGFKGQVGIVEGQSWTDSPLSYWTYQPGRWWQPSDHPGFGLTLDKFDIDWERSLRFAGQPKLFLSHVTITEPDGTTHKDTVGGNDPLVVDGMKIHQLDWGYAVRVVVKDHGKVVHDGFVTMQTSKDGPFYQGAVKAPSADPDIGLNVYFWPYAPNRDGKPQLTGAPWADAPLLAFEEYRGDLRPDVSQNVNKLDKTFLESKGAGALRPGQGTELGDGVVVTFPEWRRWVGFQVSRQPTIPFLLLGAGLVLLGLLPALYAYRRRLWAVAAIDPETSRTVVTVGGRAFQRSQAFTSEHTRLLDDLAHELDAEPVTAPATPTDAPPETEEPATTEVVHR